MKSEAPKTSAGTSLGCLFLMMADTQYKPVKKFLHEAFLVEKQQYPCDMLAMKRFMVDFIGTDTGKPKRHQQQQPKADPFGGTDVTFVFPD